MQFELPNGYRIDIYGRYDDAVIELVNPKGYTITGRKITDEELKILNEKFSD